MEINCEAHNQPLGSFCLTCEDLVCMECMWTICKGHLFESPEKMMEKVQPEF